MNTLISVPRLMVVAATALGAPFAVQGAGAVGDSDHVSKRSPNTNPIYEWTFDRADLSAALGSGSMDYADGATPALTSFGTTDGAVVPHIGGRPATYMHVPAFVGLGNGYLLTFTQSGPNGGGDYINQYTFIADVLIPGSLDWTPLFNTAPDNSNDGDWYVASDGSVGIGDLGYSAANVVLPNAWCRLAFAADLAANVVRYYCNGNLICTGSGSGLLDGRFSLYSNKDAGADLLLFNEGDTGGVYTHELYVAGVAFTDRPLSTDEIVALGGPRAEGIFVKRLQVTSDGLTVFLNWEGESNVSLQTTTTLVPAVWQDVPGTLGASSYSIAAPDGTAFYRLWRQ